MSPIAAFFDLDRTLIDCNSGLLWAQAEWKSGHIHTSQFVQATLWTGLYHLSLIDMNAAMRKALAHYRGADQQEIDARTRHWFTFEVARRVRKKALAAVEEHRARGHRLVMLTNSSNYEARAACERWGFDDFLANRFLTDDDGKLTGEFEPPMCYAEGKVVRATTWSQEHGYSLARSFFYTDSYSDRAMLEAVGEPRVVCPDPRLRRLALRKPWPILDW